METKPIRYIIGIILAILVLLLMIFTLYQHYTHKPQEQNLTGHLNITSNLSIQPISLIFNADYVNFTDGNLTLSTTQPFLFNFGIVDYIEWNIGNETYIYNKITQNKQGEN